MNMPKYNAIQTSALINMITGETDPFYTEYLSDLRNLNRIVMETGEFMEGNIFYMGTYHPTDTLHQPFRDKRMHYAMFSLANDVVVEIGVNAGHSALLTLTANINVTYIGADICHHAYTIPCYQFLKNQYGNRMEFMAGDSADTIPRLFDKYPQIKPRQIGFIIDGGHSVEQAAKDVYNVLTLAKPGDQIMIDDVNDKGIAYIALLAQMQCDLTPLFYNATDQIIFKVN